MFLIDSFWDFFIDIKQKKIPFTRIPKRFILCVLGFSGKDIINYRLYERKINMVIDFVPYFKRIKLRGNEKMVSSKILQNKYQTLKVLSEIPVSTSSPQYLVINGELFRLNDDNLRIKQRTNIIAVGNYVIKPINERWGKGIRSLNIVENAIEFSDCKVLQELMEEYGVLLIEKKLQNHYIMEQLSESSLNTLRIITVRTQSDNIIVVFACVRFSKVFVDNWSAGGFAANIDVNTGIAQSAVKKDSISDDAVCQITEGLRIPYFEEAKQISIMAHEYFKDMKSIGWDVAITPNGAVIVEGNDDWDVILPQKLMQKGIKKILCE